MQLLSSAMRRRRRLVARESNAGRFGVYTKHQWVNDDGVVSGQYERESNWTEHIAINQLPTRRDKNMQQLGGRKKLLNHSLYVWTGSQPHILSDRHLLTNYTLLINNEPVGGIRLIRGKRIGLHVTRQVYYLIRMIVGRETSLLNAAVFVLSNPIGLDGTPFANTLQTSNKTYIVWIPIGPKTR